MVFWIFSVIGEGLKGPGIDTVKNFIAKLTSKQKEQIKKQFYASFYLVYVTEVGTAAELKHDDSSDYPDWWDDFLKNLEDQIDVLIDKDTKLKKNPAKIMKLLEEEDSIIYSSIAKSFSSYVPTALFVKMESEERIRNFSHKWIQHYNSAINEDSDRIFTTITHAFLVDGIQRSVEETVRDANERLEENLKEHIKEIVEYYPINQSIEVSSADQEEPDIPEYYATTSDSITQRENHMLRYVTSKLLDTGPPVLVQMLLITLDGNCAVTIPVGEHILAGMSQTVEGLTRELGIGGIKSIETEIEGNKGSMDIISTTCNNRTFDDKLVCIFTIIGYMDFEYRKNIIEYINDNLCHVEEISVNAFNEWLIVAHKEAEKIIDRLRKSEPRREIDGSREKLDRLQLDAKTKELKNLFDTIQEKDQLLSQSIDRIIKSKVSESAKLIMVLKFPKPNDPKYIYIFGCLDNYEWKVIPIETLDNNLLVGMENLVERNIIGPLDLYFEPEIYHSIYSRNSYNPEGIYIPLLKKIWKKEELIDRMKFRKNAFIQAVELFPFCSVFLKYQCWGVQKSYELIKFNENYYDNTPMLDFHGSLKDSGNVLLYIFTKIPTYFQNLNFKLYLIVGEGPLKFYTHNKMEEITTRYRRDPFKIEIANSSEFIFHFLHTISDLDNLECCLELESKFGRIRVPLNIHNSIEVPRTSRNYPNFKGWEKAKKGDKYSVKHPSQLVHEFLINKDRFLESLMGDLMKQKKHELLNFYNHIFPVWILFEKNNERYEGNDYTKILIKYNEDKKFEFKYGDLIKKFLIALHGAPITDSEIDSDKDRSTPIIYEENDGTIRLDNLELKGDVLTLYTSKTTYYDYLATNLSFGFDWIDRKTKLFYPSTFEELKLENSIFANHIGINAMVFFNEPTEPFKTFVTVRSEETATNPSGVAPSISGTIRGLYLKDCLEVENLNELITYSIKEQGNEELKIPQIWFSYIKIIGATQDLIRGGLPDFFAIARLSISSKKFFDYLGTVRKRSSKAYPVDAWEYKQIKEIDNSDLITPDAFEKKIKNFFVLDSTDESSWYKKQPMPTVAMFHFLKQFLRKNVWNKKET